MSIVENKERIGRPTSSKAYLLIPEGKRIMTISELEEFQINNPKSKVKSKKYGFQQGGKTYIEEKADEKMLGRSLDLGESGKSATWGLFLERFVFDKLGMEYEIKANETKVYNDYLAGSTDLIVPNVKVSDIKCYEPKKFCKYTRMILAKDTERFKKDFPQEYWQLVSNALINDVPNAEAICFMPNEEELEQIQQMAYDYDGADQFKYRFIYESEKSQLAYIPKGSKFKNLNIFEFEVPKEDKELLISRVELAGIEIDKLIID